MEPSKGEESGEMYSPDKQGEYTSEVAVPEGTPHFSIQGLVDVLMTEIPDVQLLLSVEFALQLEVMMANHSGHPHPLAFLWNVGMVMHVLKSDPMLRGLEHIQVDGPGMAYLFFFDKQGMCGLMHEATQAMQVHVGEAFAVNCLPLVERWCHVVVASERCRHRSWAECQGPAIPVPALSESDSTLQLVGSAPPSTARLGSAEDNEGNKSARSITARLLGRPPKAQPMVGGGGNSPPSSPEQEGADSDGYFTVSEAPGGWCRRRRCRNEKCLAPACLNMIFKSTDPNVDVTYTLWIFNLQGWLDQYDEASMIPHIFVSLQVYPSK